MHRNILAGSLHIHWLGYVTCANVKSKFAILFQIHGFRTSVRDDRSVKSAPKFLSCNLPASPPKGVESSVKCCSSFIAWHPNSRVGPTGYLRRSYGAVSDHPAPVIIPPNLFHAVIIRHQVHLALGTRPQAFYHLSGRGILSQRGFRLIDMCTATIKRSIKRNLWYRANRTLTILDLQQFHGWHFD
jgi:hypothetical protein